MMRLSIGEVRFILNEMHKELALMEKAGVAKHQAVLQFEYFRTTLDKKMNELINNRKPAREL